MSMSNYFLSFKFFLLSAPALALVLAVGQFEPATAAKIHEKVSPDESVEKTEELVEHLTGDMEKPLPLRSSIPSTAKEYLETFDLAGRRDPFSEMSHDAGNRQADSSWWDQASGEHGHQEEIRFDGSDMHISNASLERLPSIKVNGVMQVSGRRAVCANIQNKGSYVLHENDRIVLEGNANTKISKWLIIKQIHRNGMTVILDNGREITGKFY